MFSLKPLDKEYSRSFAVIIQKKYNSSKEVISRNVVETIYHTELMRDRDIDENYDFTKNIQKYCKSTDNDEWILKDEYEYEMACHNRVSKGFERFIKIIYGPSGSGKTYTLAKLIKRFKQVFPKNEIIYASVNDVANEPAFDSLTTKQEVIDEKTKKKSIKDVSIIKEISLQKIENPIDVFDPVFKDSLVLFDDLDANCGVFSYTDLDPTLTPEKFKDMSIKDKSQITNLVKRKMEVVSTFMKQSAISIVFNARKQRINFCYIFHAFFNNKFENELLGEASSVVIFPQKADKSTLGRWLRTKLLFDKEEANYLINRPWRRWDFCEIDLTSSRKFSIMNDTLKLF